MYALKTHNDTVSVRSGRHLVRQVTDTGMSLDDVFFKCRLNDSQTLAGRRRFLQNLFASDDHFTHYRLNWDPLFDDDKIRAEFKELQILNSRFPESFAKPIAMVLLRYEGRLLGYLAEYIEGRTLEKVYSDVITAEGRDGSAGRYLTALMQYLEIAKMVVRSGSVHGDLAERNAILTPAGRVVVIDPGKSLVSDSESIMKLEAKVSDMQEMVAALSSARRSPGKIGLNII